MHLIYTGYYLDREGYIFDSKGTSRSRLQNKRIILSNGEFTNYTIKNGNMISAGGVPTEYTLIRNYIFGPFRCLPWLIETNLVYPDEESPLGQVFLN